MKNEVDFKPLVETFIINDVQSFNHFKNKYSMFPVAEVIHLGKDITSDINYSEFVNLCKRIEVDEDNEFFSADDQGLLYNKSKTCLLSCPMYKTGSVEIEDGVQRIAANAFYNTSIENIKIPGSVSVIEDGAFVSCQKIKTLEFCEGIYALSANHSCLFINCDEIDKLRLPSTIKSIHRCFESIRINELVLKDGIEYISEDALEYVSGIVCLPDSLKRIDRDNFKNAHKIIAKNYIDGIFSCFLSEHIHMRNKIVEIILNDEKIYMPSKMNSNHFLDLEKKILLTGFKKNYFYEAESIIAASCNDPISKNAIIMNYNLRHNHDLENYIKKNALELGERFIEYHDTNMLLQLLKTNLVSEEDLRALVAIATKMNDSIMAAYILDKHNELYSTPCNFDI